MNSINCPIFREFIVCLSFTSRFLGYLENLGIMLLDIDNYIGSYVPELCMSGDPIN